VNILFLLVPLAMIFAVFAVVLFIWAVRSGQYDDLETPAVRILFDDIPVEKPIPETPERSDGS
jgi:cbb3-type cytochrome oxidase maturation protein